MLIPPTRYMKMYSGDTPNPQYVNTTHQVHEDVYQKEGTVLKNFKRTLNAVLYRLMMIFIS